MRALQKLRVCANSQSKVQTGCACTILQKYEWNRCEESRYEADEGRSPLYARLRACQNKAGGEELVNDRSLKPTLLNICVVNREKAAPAADRTTVLTAKADAAYILRASDSVIKSPIAYRNSQICVPKVVLDLEQMLRSACASGSQMLVTYHERHGYHTYRRAVAMSTVTGSVASKTSSALTRFPSFDPSSRAVHFRLALGRIDLSNLHLLARAATSAFAFALISPHSSHLDHPTSIRSPRAVARCTSPTHKRSGQLSRVHPQVLCRARSTSETRTPSSPA